MGRRLALLGAMLAFNVAAPNALAQEKGESEVRGVAQGRDALAKLRLKHVGKTQVMLLLANKEGGLNQQTVQHLRTMLEGRTDRDNKGALASFDRAVKNGFSADDFINFVMSITDGDVHTGFPNDFLQSVRRLIEDSGVKAPDKRVAGLAMYINGSALYDMEKNLMQLQREDVENGIRPSRVITGKLEP